MVGSEDETWQCKPSAWDSTWLDDVGCKILMVTRAVVGNALPLEHGLRTTPAKTLHGLDTPSSEPNLPSKNHPLFPNSFKNSFEYFKVLTLSHGPVVFVTFSSFFKKKITRALACLSFSWISVVLNNVSSRSPASCFVQGDVIQ